MRAGRPTGHIRAKWIIWTQDARCDFYELDNSGCVVRENGKVRIHHSSNDVKSKADESGTSTDEPVSGGFQGPDDEWSGRDENLEQFVYGSDETSDWQIFTEWF